MPSPTDKLEDQQRENRDSNMRLARKMREAGRIIHMQRHVSVARNWNKELVRLKRETRH